MIFQLLDKSKIGSFDSAIAFICSGLIKLLTCSLILQMDLIISTNNFEVHSLHSTSITGLYQLYSTFFSPLPYSITLFRNGFA